MATLRYLTSKTKSLSWDEAKAAAGDAVAQKALESARTRFREHLHAGGTALTHQPSGTYKQVKVFDPSAEELILVPPVAGG